MMNHKECFQKYGRRRPLKVRRLLARRDRRFVSQLNKRERWRGLHTYWWREGQAALAWEEYAREHNISLADQEAMQEEMPF